MTTPQPRGLAYWAGLLFPFAVFYLCLIYLALVGYRVLGTSAERAAFDFDAFGRIPVVEDGRVKPLDSVARNHLLLASARQSYRQELTQEERQNGATPVTASAPHWLLDVLTQSEAGKAARSFRIDSGEIKALLGVKEDSRTRFSFAELEPHLDDIEAKADEANKTPAGQQTAYQHQVLELYKKLVAYHRLGNFSALFPIPPAGGPEEPVAEGKDWQNLVEARDEVEKNGAARPAFRGFVNILAAYGQNQPEWFNQAVTQYRQALAGPFPHVAAKARFEALFNRSEVFVHALSLYVLAFLLACFSWLFWRRPLARAALWVRALGLLLHTLGLAARVYIHGRPPVTNLYASAVFVGWGVVLLALVLELIFRKGVGTAVAAVVGFLTLIIAHNLAADGDTMSPMRAVLDSNFWLTSHVLVVTFGYSATFLAGALAILYILLGLFAHGTDETLGETIARMVYGIICFATLFSFVGTILGGIWADQSWGRFWGWDPKENGALLIVIWNALILHARWGRLVGPRGMAVLAVAGNIVTAWSWFGVNLLGIGLHSYGFMQGGLFWLALFVFSQIVVMGLGMLPEHLWLGYKGRSAAVILDEPATT